VNVTTYTKDKDYSTIVKNPFLVSM